MIESINRCGRVVSGRGKASLWLAGRKELFDYFGTAPQPGSLNIILDWPVLFRPERAKVRLEAGRNLAWPARVEGQPCLVQRWSTCPLHVVEVISPYRFQIQKGSRAIVEFDVADTAQVAWDRLFIWGLLWYLRRSRVYSDKSRWAKRIARRLQRWSGQLAVQDFPNQAPIIARAS